MRFFITTFLLFLFSNLLFAQQTPVKVATITTENKASKRLITGNLMNQNVAKVASEEAGLVEMVGFRLGEIVKKGTVLYKLDTRNVVLDLELANVELKKANSTYEQKVIETSFAEKELTRRKIANEKTPGVVSEQDFAKFQNEFAVAKEILNMAKIEKELREVKIKIINKQMHDMVIKAPFDGFIRVKGKEVGEWVNKGEMVVVLVALDAYEAYFEIPQSISLQSLMEIKELEVNIEGANKTYTANQFNFIVGVNENSRNYTVAGLIKGPSLDLISGKSISAYIPIGAEKPFIKINSNAVIKDPAGSFVYKISPMPDKSTVAMQIAVKVEFVEGEYHYCTSAMLQSGDQVVTEGNERLRPMTPIMVIGEKK
jgi:membrane fusion protein (multidrug efflux system)